MILRICTKSKAPSCGGGFDRYFEFLSKDYLEIESLFVDTLLPFWIFTM